MGRLFYYYKLRINVCAHSKPNEFKVLDQKYRLVKLYYCVGEYFHISVKP